MGWEPSDRRIKMAEFAHLRDLGEKAYDEMFEAPSFSAAGTCFGKARDSFNEAIRLANELGLAKEVDAIAKRIEHIKSVYSHQFTQ